MGQARRVFAVECGRGISDESRRSATRRGNLQYGSRRIQTRWWWRRRWPAGFPRCAPGAQAGTGRRGKVRGGRRHDHLGARRNAVPGAAPERSRGAGPHFRQDAQALHPPRGGRQGEDGDVALRRVQGADHLPAWLTERRPQPASRGRVLALDKDRPAKAGGPWKSGARRTRLPPFPPRRLLRGRRCEGGVRSRSRRAGGSGAGRTGSFS